QIRRIAVCHLLVSPMAPRQYRSVVYQSVWYRRNTRPTAAPAARIRSPRLRSCPYPTLSGGACPGRAVTLRGKRRARDGRWRRCSQEGSTKRPSLNLVIACIMSWGNHGEAAEALRRVLTDKRRWRESKSLIDHLTHAGWDGIREDHLRIEHAMHPYTDG